MGLPAQRQRIVIPPLSRDGWVIMAAASVRMLAYGFVSVILGLFLAELGYDGAGIGALFSIALAGGAVMTLALSLLADWIGRRRLLVLGSLLMAVAGAVLAATDQIVLLAGAAILGTISPSGKDVGPFLSLEQAAIPQTTAATHRTSAFAFYNMVGLGAGALGALATGVPPLLGVAPLLGYRAMLWAYAVAGLLLSALYLRLSPAVEAAAGRARRGDWTLPRSRGIVGRLAGLFSLDAFAGGFIVQSLLAYWFYLRFGVDGVALGGIFFGANLLSAASFLAAVPLARRIGLLNTMVFTHLPSNLLLMLVPLMPTVETAVVLYLVRNLLSQMDVPTRQSYTMAVVDPAERAAAAGVLSVARTGATAAAPILAGATLAAPALGLPFLVAGGLKVIYDLSILFTFRHIRPPEESR